MTLTQMEEIVAEVNKLATSSRVVNYDQEVYRVLQDFQAKLPEKLSESEVATYDSALIKLLKANNGIISPHCAKYIATNLVSVYKLEKSHRFWNLISSVTESPSPAIIWAVGHVVKKIGHYSKSSLGNIAQQLCSVKEPLVYPSLVALRSIFKICGELLSKNASAAVSFAKGYLHSQHEPTQLAAIRLFEVLVGISTVDNKKILAAAETAFKYSRSMFTNEEAAHLVALVAGWPFVKKRQIQGEAGGKPQSPSNDFALHQSGKTRNTVLEGSFTVLRKFKEKFSVIFNRFLDLLEPEFIFKNSKDLIEFARSVSLQDQGRVMAFFARDVRADVLNTFMAMNPPPFNLIRTMAFDTESTRTIAEIALKILCGQGTNEKPSACQFFVAVSNTYPDIALEYMSKCLEKLIEFKAEGQEYIGYATVVALVLSTIENKQRVIQANSEQLNKFKQVIQGVSTVTMDGGKLQSYVMVMSTLPDEYVDFDFAKTQMDRVIETFRRLAMMDEKTRRIPMNLLEYITVFLSVHPLVANALEVVESILPFSGNFTNVLLLALSQLVMQLPLHPAMHSNVTFIFLHRLLTCGFSLPFIKKRIPGLMKLPEEPFARGKAPPVGRNPLFVVEESVFSTRLCDALPGILNKLSPADFKKFTQLMIKNSNKIPATMCLLALYQSEAVPHKLPANFHESLLKNIGSDNSIRSQIVAECIAYHVNLHPDTLDSVMAYIQKYKTPASCFIEASLARHLKMSDKGILQFLNRVTANIQYPQLIDYVLHAVTELYEAKSVQMVGLGIGDEQCNFFLGLLNNPAQLSPFTLSMIGNAFERLIPVILPFLSTESTSFLVKQIMNALKYDPIHFSKVIFHYVYRAVIAFAPDIAQIYPVIYPTSYNTLAEHKLAVCGSMSDLAKLTPLDDLFDLVPQLFVLLQRTKDERSSKLIVTIASSIRNREFDPVRMTAWFRMAKQILSTNSTPGFGNATVEPNTFVKSCALQIIHALAPLLAEKELQTDCLDDLMTSTIRAIETQKKELHAKAYPILESVVTLFRYRKTEVGNRLLELYESQFSVASRHAFPNSVDLACQFLVAYLDFYFDEFEKNQQGFMMLLDAYVAGLTRVVNKDSGFFSVASKLCVLARSSQSLYEHLTPFLVTLTPVFSQLVLDSIKLRSTNADWAEVSRYRNRMSPFYSNLLPSFVWLQKIFPQDTAVIDVKTMISFFILEMTISSEAWRVYAGFAAIATVFRYFSEEIDLEFFSLMVTSCGDIARRNANLVKPIIPEFLRYTSSMLQKSAKYFEIWNTLVAILFMNDNECSATTLALLLKAAPNSEMTAKFAELVIRELTKNHISEDEAIALFTILYEMDPSCIPWIMDILCNRVSDFVNFKMTAIRRALLRCETRVVFDKVADFCITNFRNGGMEVIAQISVRRPALGMEFMARGAANEAVARIYESIDDAKIALKFLSLVLVQFEHERVKADVCAVVTKAAFGAIAQWGGDRKRGKEIASDAMRVINDADAISAGASKRGFSELSDEEKETITQHLKKFAAASKRSTKKLALKKFSTTTRRREQDGDGEWQSLEIDD